MRLETMRPFAIAITLICMLAIVVSPCHAAPAPDRVRTRLYELFHDMDPAGMSLGPGGATLSWGESYILKGFVSAYEATGDTIFLSRLCMHADNIFSIRDDYTGTFDELRGRVVPAWSSSKYTAGMNHAWFVHAGMVTFPLARFVYLARRDPALKDAFGERADRVFRRLRETVVTLDDDFVEGPGEGEGYYTGYWGGTLDTVLPLNQQNAMGRTFVALWLATGEEFYRDRAEALALFFRNRLRYDSEHDAWAWPYWAHPEGGDEGVEDVSHAGINVDFAFQCYRAGIVFDRKDMRRFANALTGLVFADGRPSADNAGGGGYNPTFADQVGRWQHLGFIEPRVADLVMGYAWDRLGTEISAGTALLTAAYNLEVTTGGFSREKPVR